MVFGQKREKFDFSTHAPEGLRLYAIGDIHGRFDLLSELMAMIRADAGGIPHRIIFLGDYVDRGDSSAQVIDYLIALKRDRGNRVVLLKGNHEQAMLDFIAAPDETFNWIDWGGAQTLESYGIADVMEQSPETLRDQLIEKLPDDHFKFLMELETWYEAGDYIFVHAGMRAGLPLHQQREQDLLWIRDAFFDLKPGTFGDTCIVHGHTPHEETPLDAGWRINIDTGAVWTGRLTAVVLEGTERRYLST